MIDPENDPILNASSINSEDYWFLKVSGVENNAGSCSDNEGGKASKTDWCSQENMPAKDKA